MTANTSSFPGRSQAPPASSHKPRQTNEPSASPLLSPAVLRCSRKWPDCHCRRGRHVVACSTAAGPAMRIPPRAPSRPESSEAKLVRCADCGAFVRADTVPVDDGFRAARACPLTQTSVRCVDAQERSRSPDARGHLPRPLPSPPPTSRVRCVDDGSFGADAERHHMAHSAYRLWRLRQRAPAAAAPLAYGTIAKGGPRPPSLGCAVRQARCLSLRIAAICARPWRARPAPRRCCPRKPCSRALPSPSPSLPAPSPRRGRARGSRCRRAPSPWWAALRGSRPARTRTLPAPRRAA